MFPLSKLLNFLSRLAFWVLAAITLLNLNGASYMLVGREQIFSPVIGLCCLYILLAGLVSVPLRQTLGIPGFLILATLTSYVFIGFSVALLSGFDSRLDIYFYLRSYINSAVLIVAAAFGGCAVLRRVGNEQLLKTILALLTMSCIAVLLSSVLADFFLITPETAANRQHGTFRGPNQAGLVGCMTVVSALSFLCAGQHRKLACLSLILGVGAIIGSNSRTAMLIVILTFAFFAIISRRGRRSIARLLFVMILIGVATLMTTDLKRVVPEILGPAQLARLEAIQGLLRGQEVYDYSINERLYLLGSALHQVAESPVVGHGLILQL